MDLYSFQEIFRKKWETAKASRYPDSELFDLDAYLFKKHENARKHAAKLIPIHFALLKHVTTTFVLFTHFVGKNKLTEQSGAFLSQLHRATNCLISLNSLLFSGYEETARPVARNFLESIDIAVACFVDREFSADLFGDNQIEFSLLWKKKIGYGHIYHYLREAGKLAGLPEEEIERHIEYRKTIKSALSGSVHGDDGGAFRSMAVPPLGYPEMLSTEPHGVISVHTADHAHMIISEAYVFLSLVIKILLSRSTHEGFENLPSEGAERQTFFAQFFTFQELYWEHDLPRGEEIVADDHDCER